MSVVQALHAELAGHRRAGLDFNTAWDRAVPVALQAACEGGWLTVLQVTRHAWEAGYERQRPTRRENAASMLAHRDEGIIVDVLDDTEPISEPLERRCVHCDDPLPAGSRANRKYCSTVCRQAQFVSAELAVA
jgi:hypothetical protein